MSRLLIVEDQPDIRRLVRWSLELEPHELHEAANGAEGLALARRVRPDLVLLDVMMPGDLDGLAVCAQIKADADLAGVRVVMLTARAQATDRDAALAAGADAFLAKPFSPLELIETIARLLKTQDAREAP
jgi:two-component system, OmpR family, phosphate regulon response regulator PhoB